MLVFYKRENGAASVISVPRDLYVFLPGRGMDRVNTAYPYGGIELLYETLEYNLGVRPHHWALAHLNDFVNFVDELGGIDVRVNYPLPDDCGGIPEGKFHMNGLQALCYVRERKTSNDFIRSRRQQKVFQVILQRFFTLDGILHLPEWYNRYQGSVQTDLSLEDLISLAPFGFRLQDGAVYHYQIAAEQVESYHVPASGAAVLLPRRDVILPLIQTAVDQVSVPIPTSPAFQERLADLTSTPEQVLEPTWTVEPTAVPELTPSPEPTQTLMPSLEPSPTLEISTPEPDSTPTGEAAGE
jgi:LCP family protein required for cell wall assembly